MSAPIFASAVDERGFAWFARWVELGGQFDLSDGGFNLAPPASLPDDGAKSEIIAMVQEVHATPLLAHAVARSFLNYRRWEQVTEGGRTYPDGTVRS